MTSPIQIGSTVVLHFTLKLADNSVADTTKQAQPSRFLMTEKSLHDPVESALLGKTVGEKVRVSLAPEDGYGPVREDNMHRLESHRFPKDVVLQVGDIYKFDKPNGETLTGVIRQVERDSVLVDFNHPLAGKDLLCEMEILEVIPPSNPSNE